MCLFFSKLIDGLGICAVWDYYKWVNPMSILITVPKKYICSFILNSHDRHMPLTNTNKVMGLKQFTLPLAMHESSNYPHSLQNFLYCWSFSIFFVIL